MDVPVEPTAPKKLKRNYETYYKKYYEEHKEAINKRRSTGKPRGRPKKVVEGYESSTSTASNISV
jgi:hypothetical protein